METMEQNKQPEPSEEIKPSVEGEDQNKQNEGASPTEGEILEKKKGLKARIDHLLFRKPEKKVSIPDSYTSSQQMVSSEEGEKESDPLQEMWDNGDQIGATKRMIKEALLEVTNSAKKEEIEEKELDNIRTIRTEANREVWEKYPEILDVDEGIKKPEEVPLYQEMQKVYQENPYLLEIPDGPKLALELAEGRFGNKNKGSSQVSPPSFSAESRARGSENPRGKLSKPLSAEQERVARKMGLTNEEYNKFSLRAPVTNATYYDKYKKDKMRSI